MYELTFFDDELKVPDERIAEVVRKKVEQERLRRLSRKCFEDAHLKFYKVLEKLQSLDIYIYPADISVGGSRKLSPRDMIREILVLEEMLKDTRRALYDYIDVERLLDKELI
jgi:hypothetical protein